MFWCFDLRRETVYETPHSLLDNISLGYRQVFIPHLVFFVKIFSTSILRITFPSFSFLFCLDHLSRHSLFSGFWRPPLLQAGKVEGETRKWGKTGWSGKKMKKAFLNCILSVSLFSLGFLLSERTSRVSPVIFRCSLPKAMSISRSEIFRRKKKRQKIQICSQ